LGVVGSFGEGSNGTRNPFNASLDYGPQNADVKHNFVASFIWDLPSLPAASGFVQGVLGGWQLNGITTIRSGFPFTVRSGRDNSLTGIGGDTADVSGDPDLPDGRSDGEKIQEFFDTSAFSQNDRGTFGTTGINSVRGPGFWNFDLAINKQFPITETKRLEFRTSFFNFFNNANFGSPNSNLSSPAFGRITNVQGDPRVIEFGLKFFF